MKLLFFTLSSYALFTLTSCSQKIEEAKVPAKVKTAFDKQFPGVTAAWEKENGKYEANFKMDNNNESASFTLDGTMTESEIEISEKELPENIRAYCAEHYKGKKIESAAKINMADGSLNYEANINDKDVLFDNSGNFIKEVKE